MKIATFSLTTFSGMIPTGSARILKNVMLVLVFTSAVFSLHGQVIQSVAPHIPTSPQGEAFQRYGEYAINYSMGIPDISIPLYEINHRGYKLPMVLKYNPQPLKPSYNYDVYGQGWGLSINSCISRSIEYVPDEWRNFKIEQNIFNEFYYICPECARLCMADASCDMTQQPKISPSDYNLAHDKFNVVLPNGTSFNFVIDEGPVFTVSDGRQVKISCDINTQSIISFTIVDEDGVKYTFDGGDLPYNAKYGNYVTWQLSKIELPYSTEPITFIYNDYVLTPFVGSTCDEPKVLLRHLYGCETNELCYKVPNLSFNYYKMKYLSSINYGNTSISLSYKDESGLPGYNNVTGIMVRENSSLVRSIGLSMSIHDITTFCGILKVAKLDNITINGSNPSDIPLKYECTYGSLGDFYSGTDHWGYLNHSTGDVGNFNLFCEFNVDAGSLSAANMSAVEKSSQEITPFYKYKLSTRSNFDCRQPEEPSGVLTMLKFPTGGYTEFLFENHQFLTSTDGSGNYIFDYQRKQYSFAAGYRIKKITNYTADGVVSDIKNFKYGKTDSPDNIYDPNSHTGLGVAVVEPTVLTYMEYSSIYCPFPILNMILGLDQSRQHNPIYENPFINAGCQTRAVNGCSWECTFSASNFRRILNGRSSVVYPEVTVYYGDIGGWLSTPAKTTGKTVYKYDVTEHSIDLLGNLSDNFFEQLRYHGNSLEYDPQSYRYNKLLERLDYSVNGQGFKLVKKESNSWRYNSSLSTDYLDSHLFPENITPKDITVGGLVSGKYNNLGNALLDGKAVVMYDNNGDSIVSVENYDYNNRAQLITKTSKNSNTKTLKTTFGYPETVRIGTTPDIIQKMLLRNMISPVIISTTSSGFDPNLQEISGNKTDFSEFTAGTSKIIMPAQAYELEINPSGNQYVLRNQINSYSTNGNPLEFVSKDGIRSSYVWGYSDRYMVIKADNIDNTTLTSLVTSSLPSGFPTLEALLGSVTTLPNNNWTDFNINLRNYASAIKAMVTTYTYAPLIGMTSSTDPNSVTTYYEYDAFGRLKLVRDKDGKILKTYDYHYKQ